MTLVIIVWVLWNIYAPKDLRWDEYPFIFLTLMLSLQASYAAPLILLAQNRQDDRDRVTHEQDRQQTGAPSPSPSPQPGVAALRMGLGAVAARPTGISSSARPVRALSSDRQGFRRVDGDAAGPLRPPPP
ncbi:Membrane protein OS=Streptomyces microflavus OX=1919 GN=Smic_54850 PE=4 SV=1 [Streptomyces microflavus]